MKFPVVKKSCWGCMHIRMGSIVIAVFIQVLYFISLIVSLTFLTGQADWKIGLAALSPQYISRTSYTNLSIANVVASVVCIISHSLLIIGILTRKRILMIPCLALSFLWLTAGTIVAIAFYAIWLAPASHDVVFLTLLAVALAIAYCIGLYLFLVVFSYFKELVPPKEAQVLEQDSENVPLGDAELPTTKEPM